MIMQLNLIAEMHNNDNLSAGDLNITKLCNYMISKLEMLLEYESIGTVEEFKKAVKPKRRSVKK